MKFLTRDIGLKLLALALAIVIYHALKTNRYDYNLRAPVHDRQQIQHQ